MGISLAMSGEIPVNLQKAQAEWMKNWHRYLLGRMGMLASALEVGCGCGYVMENIKGVQYVAGIDSSISEVNCAKNRGLNAFFGDAKRIPFPDKSFDLVYGNYVLMWNKEPKVILNEMRRVSKKYVAIFAEPYWSGAVCDSSYLRNLAEKSREFISTKGGNPDAGLDLPGLFFELFGDFEIGTIPLVTTHKDMVEMIEFEKEILNLKEDTQYGNLLYVPTFWAFGRVD